MYSLEKNQVLKTLNTSINGLSSKEAEKRLKQNGKNELDKDKKFSFIKCFFKQFLNIMVGILLVSAVVSISLAIIKKEYTDLFEGFVIFFIVIMNALIGVFQESKANACLKDLQKYSKVNVRVIRDGKVISIDSTLVAEGDIVIMEAGNIVVADMRLIESVNFAVDESSLTGESVASNKNADEIFNKNTPLAERKNMVYAGSPITNGKAVGVVVKTGKNTEIGKIAKLLNSHKKERTPLQKSIDKIGKVITFTVLIVCAIILSIQLIKGNSLVDAIMVSISLAVAAIPESLPAVITIILALGVEQLAKRKCVIKHLHAVETLGSCEVICTDKTGTLTLNKMQVVKTFNADNGDIKNNIQFLNCMQLCTSCKLEYNMVVGESTEKAIYEYALEFKQDIFDKVIKEIPFSSARKMMTVITENEVCYSKGAPEKIIKNCKFIKINGKIEEFSVDLKQKIEKVHKEMTDNALRVIAFAYKNGNTESETDLIFLGMVGIKDNPRPEVKSSIEKCFKAGLKPVMITGDNKYTAFAIAKEINIAKSINEVITGEEIDKLTDKQLSKVCYRYSVYARVTPEHKVRIVQAYKGCKKIVAMTGDGVNDAPSLKVADIGVGMGKSGTDVVKSVADMLVTDDNFSSIVVAVEEGRKVYSNIQKALQFLISTNCVEVFGMLLCLLMFPRFTFLLPAQMLFINLVTDSLPALALGVEKVEKEAMQSPPRNSRAGLFGGVVGKAIIYQSVLQTLIAIVVFVVGVYCYNPNVASTMVFFTIIFMQLLHSINCKTNSSLIGKNLFDNKTFNICFIITLVLNLSVACIPVMYTIFNLQFLNFSQWLVVGIASVLIIPCCELFKVIISKKN